MSKYRDIAKAFVEANPDTPRLPAQPSRYAEAARAVVQEPQRAAAVNLETDRQPNPEAAGEANRIARDLALPESTIENDLAEMRRKWDMGRVEPLLKNDPSIAAWAANARNAKVAPTFDDLFSLTSIGKQVREIPWTRTVERAQEDIKSERISKGATLSEEKAPKVTPFNVARGIGVNFGTGFRNAGIGFDLMAADALGTGELDRETLFRQKRRNDARAQAANPDFETQLARDVYGGGVSLAQGLPAVLSGIVSSPFITPAGGTALSLSLLSGQVGGQAYGKYRERGGTPGEAALGAAGEAGIEAATEFLPMGFLVSRLGKSGLADFFGNFFLREFPGEQIATFLQDAIDTAVANPDKTWDEFWAERPEAARATAVGTLVMAGGMGALNQGIRLALGRDEDPEQARMEQAQAEAETLGKLLETAAENPVRLRDPVAFQEYLQSQTGGTPVETIYVPAEKVLEFYQSQGIEPGAADDPFMGWLEGFGRQMQQAIVSNGDIAIPTAGFAANLAGSPMWEALKDDMRLSPDGLSPNEARALKETEQARKELDRAMKAERVANVAAEVAPVAAIYADQIRQLQGAGFTPQQAKANALLVAERYRARGAALGIDPLELYRQDNVTVERTVDGVTMAAPAPAAPAPAVEPAQEAADGGARPDFLVRGAQGQPIIVRSADGGKVTTSKERGKRKTATSADTFIVVSADRAWISQPTSSLLEAEAWADRLVEVNGNRDGFPMGGRWMRAAGAVETGADASPVAQRLFDAIAAADGEAAEPAAEGNERPAKPQPSQEPAQAEARGGIDLSEGIAAVNDALKGGVSVSQQGGVLYVNLPDGRRIAATRPGELTEANSRNRLAVADRAARIAGVSAERAAAVLRSPIEPAPENAAEEIGAGIGTPTEMGASISEQAPLTIETLPQQLLMQAREAGGSFRPATAEERRALDEAGIPQNEDGTYPTDHLAREADRRYAAGQWDSRMGSYDNSHIAALKERYAEKPAALPGGIKEVGDSFTVDIADEVLGGVMSYQFTFEETGNVRGVQVVSIARQNGEQIGRTDRGWFKTKEEARQAALAGIMRIAGVTLPAPAVEPAQEAGGYVGQSWESVEGTRSVEGLATLPDGSVRYRVGTAGSQSADLLTSEQVERQRQIDASRLANAKAVQQAQAEKAAREEAERADRLNLHGFGENLPAVQRERIATNLAKAFVLDGDSGFAKRPDLTRKKFIEELHLLGANIGSSKDGKPRLSWKRDGQDKAVNVTKTEADYFQHLRSIDWKPAPEAADGGAAEPAAVQQPDAEQVKARLRKERKPIVRKGPVDVLTYIADRGGIRNDEGHDLRNIGDFARVFVPRSGPLLRKNGLSIDAVGELILQAGYMLPQTGEAQTVSEADVLDYLTTATEGWRAGKRTFTLEEQFEGEEKRAAAVQQDELTQLLSELDAVAAEAGISLSDTEKQDVLAYAGSLQTSDMGYALESWLNDDSWLASQQVAEETGDPEDDVPFETVEERYASDETGDPASSGESNVGRADDAGDQGAGSAQAGVEPATDGSAADSFGAVAAETDQLDAFNTARDEYRAMLERKTEGPAQPQKEQKGVGDLALFDTAAHQAIDLFSVNPTPPAPEPEIEAIAEPAPEPEPTTEALAADILQDAGEKFGGARKDLWALRGLSLSDLENMSEADAFKFVTKDQVWPKPDYAKMVADGLSPQAAAIQKVVRDQQAAKPKADNADARRAYIEMMQIIREEVEKITDLDSARGLQNRIMARVGWPTQRLERPSDAARRLMFATAKARTAAIGAGYSEIQKATKLVQAGFPGMIEPWTRRFVVYQGRADSWYVVTKGSRRILVRDLPSKEEAERQAKALYEDKGEEGQKARMPERPHLDEVKRTGKDVRGGRNITSEDFIKEFGFRGVEFGNWAAGDERQALVNFAFEALHDLAGVLGADPRALSLGGRLGIAFGARGTGRAAAHYEPGKLVINLTKLSGAGSLAHEWAHALDHYFGEIDREKGSKGNAIYASNGDKDWDGVQRRLPNVRPAMRDAWERVLQTMFRKMLTRADMIRRKELDIETYRGRIVELEKRLADARAQVEQKGRESAASRRFINETAEYIEGLKVAITRAEEMLVDLRDEIKPLPRMMGTETQYFREAKKLSGKSGASGYWARPTEMVARSFESWVFDQIKAQGGQSDYLVHGVEDGAHPPELYVGDPYPAGEERQAINAAWADLVANLETRETADGALEFFQSTLPPTIDVDGRQRPTMNSEGRPIHPTEEGIRNFWRWFGDSKVVDDQGRPLVVYHGTATDFEAFDPSKVGSTFEVDSVGFFFTSQSREAEKWASAAERVHRRRKSDVAGYRVVEAYLAVSKPWTIQVDTSTDTGKSPVAHFESGDGVFNRGQDKTLQYAVSSGYDGLIVRDTVVDGSHEAMFVAFNPTQIKSATGNDGTFDPEDARIYRQTERGRIRLTDTGSIIQLHADANESTYLHEMGHLWLEQLRADAQRPEAPQWLKDDWQAVQDWFAANGLPMAPDGPIPVAAHEMWARGIERYAMEGKSPSLALRKVFERFMGWLTNIYRNVAALNSPITPEIRRVMDRLLTVEDASAKAFADGQFTLLPQAELGMTDEAYAALQASAAEAVSDAKAELLNKAMSQVRARRQAEYRAERDELRAKVEAEINARPLVRAYHLLLTGNWLDEPDREPQRVRFSRELLVAAHGPEAPDLMPRSIPPMVDDERNPNGIHPDEIAEMVGMASGDELVRGLMAIRQEMLVMRERGDKRGYRTALIENAVDAEMDSRHAELLDEGAVLAEAKAVLANEKMGEVLAAELRAITRATGGGATPTPFVYVRAWAREQVRQGKGKDYLSTADAAKHARAAAKAGREAFDLLAKGDREGAALAKQRQMVAHALHMEAKEANQEVRAAYKRMLKLARRTRAGSIDIAYFDKIHEMLEAYGLKDPRDDREGPGFVEWLLAKAAAGEEVALPPGMSGFAIPQWDTLTVNELLALADSIEALAHLGRQLGKLKIAGQEQALEDAVAEAEANASDRPDIGKPTEFNEEPKRRRKAVSALLKIEKMADWLDGGDPNGIWNRLLIQRATEAANEKRRLQDQVLLPIAKLYHEMDAGHRKRLASKVTLDRLTDPDTGQPITMTRMDLLSVALNMGNEENARKLAEGYRWNEQAIRDTLNEELTEADWQFVQAVWDQLETLWPHIVRVARAMTGITPDKVAAMPVETPFGTLRGGYYPIVYDRKRTGITDGTPEDDAQDMLANIGPILGTATGHEKSRTNARGPLLLQTEAVLLSHIHKVANRIAYAEYLRDVLKFLRHPKIKKLVRDKLGQEYYEQFMPWLRAQVTDGLVNQEGGAWWNDLARKARTNISMVGMGLRWSTGIAQIAGVTSTANQIGAQWMATGLKEWARNPWQAQRFVFERSEEMARRSDEFDRDVRDFFREIQGGATGLDKVRAIGFWHIAMADRMVSLSAWLGAYRKALAEGMEEPDARAFGDKAVRLSQGTGRVKDLAAVQRPNSEALKLFTMFYSYFNVQFNEQWEAQRRVRGGRKGDYHRAFVISWWMMVAAPLAGALLTGDWPGEGDGDDDAERWRNWTLRTLTFNLFAGVPVVRDLASTLNRTVSDQYAAWNATPADRALQSTWNLGRDIVAVFDEDMEPSSRWLKHAIETPGYFLGLPTGQPATTAQFLWDVWNGDQEPETVRDWYVGLTKGRVPEDS